MKHHLSLYLIFFEFFVRILDDTQFQNMILKERNERKVNDIEKMIYVSKVCQKEKILSGNIGLKISYGKRNIFN